MREREFRDYCLERGLSEEQTELAVKAIQEFEEDLARACRGRTFESLKVEDVKEYVSLLVTQGRSSIDRLLALARYSSVVKKNDVYIFFASILGARNVLPTLSDRLASMAGEETRRIVFDSVDLPSLGSPPERYPAVTQRLIERLESELSPEMCRKVLAGNMHCIPVESLREHRERFLQLGSIDRFLKELHNEAVAELERLMAEGRLFYEQEITPHVIEFVRANQEMLAGVRLDDKIYLTKIPYAPKDYLKETDPKMKRYYACHCPLARASILEANPNVSPMWCYCSGGYEKLLFDVVFDEEVDVEVLESALAGNMRCRFTVSIPEGKRTRN
jgi:hypothetical protein